MSQGDWVLLKETLDMSWADLSEAIGISERQLYRYVDQTQKTPQKVQLAIEGLICRVVHQKLPTQRRKAR